MPSARTRHASASPSPRGPPHSGILERGFRRSARLSELPAAQRLQGDLRALRGWATADDPVDVLTGCLSAEGDALGCPAGVVVDRQGALLVADDVGNRIWRVTAAD